MTTSETADNDTLQTTALCDPFSFNKSQVSQGLVQKILPIKWLFNI
jgi:hypothetical protein